LYSVLYINLYNLLKRILKYICCDQSSIFCDGSISVGENEEFLKKGSKPVLVIESTGHALHAFVNQEYQGYLLIDNKFITLYFINQLSLCVHVRIVGSPCLLLQLIFLPLHSVKITCYFLKLITYTSNEVKWNGRGFLLIFWTI